MEESKKIFLSGPMTGIEKYNFPKFDFYETAITEHYPEVSVVNPANIARKYKVKEVLADKHVFDKMIIEELQALMECDSILLFDGWETSVGAKKELLFALQLGKRVILEKDMLRFENKGESK